MNSSFLLGVILSGVEIIGICGIVNFKIILYKNIFSKNFYLEENNKSYNIFKKIYKKNDSKFTLIFYLLLLTSY